MRQLFAALCLCAAIHANAQPPNDECSSTTPVALSIGSTITLTGTRTGATTTNDGVPGNVLMTTPNVATVWESFTTTECSNVTVLFCGTPLPATTMWNFITTTCPADVPIYFSYANFGVLCPNGQFGIQWFNLPAGTYNLPIYCTPAGGAYSIELSAAVCIPGPANDECAGAVPLAVNSTCMPVDGSVENATFSFPAAECNGATGNPNDDVWFSFVATAGSQIITVDPLGTGMDVTVELFADGCASSTPIACADATFEGGTEVLVAEGLQVGDPYHFRVFHYFTSWALDPDFTVCVTGDVGSGLMVPNMPSVVLAPALTDGPCTISGAAPGSAFRLVDRAGRTVQQGRIAGDRHALDLSALPSGVYLVEVSDPRVGVERRTVVRH